jgi:hypothetical protein
MALNGGNWQYDICGILFPFAPLAKDYLSPKFIQLIGKDKKPFKLDMKFIQWLVGFTDGEVNISLIKNKKKYTKSSSKLFL